jgi:hypothetical protein
VAVFGILLTLLVPLSRQARDLHPTRIEPTKSVAPATTESARTS